MKEAFLQAIKDDPYCEANHYVFADWLEENGFDEEAKVQREWTKDKQNQAEKFMEEYANQLSGDQWTEEDEDAEYRTVTVEELIEKAKTNLGNPEDDYDEIHLNFDTPNIVYEKREKFWRHFEVLTGIPVAEGYREIFVSCSC